MMLLGLSMSTWAVSGIVIYIISSKIIKTLGTVSTIGFTYVVWFLRFFSLSCITNPFFILLIECLHGFTFDLSNVAYMEYIRKISDPRVFTTMVSIKNTLHVAGRVLANIFGGMLYKAYGGKRMFFVTSLACIVWFVVVMIFKVRKYVKDSRAATSHLFTEMDDVCSTGYGVPHFTEDGANQ